MRQLNTDSIDLSTSKNSSIVFINGASQFSIQPILTSLVGNPTYTLEVSNIEDDATFIKFDDTTTDILITDFIQSDFDKFPWRYLRLAYTTDVGVTGFVIFNVSI